ncbi:SIS domain-containing protein [bacterium]|nr:SIS domain-containing protein [bacterium]MBU1983576.1 SIS domain-containing protein [bacterium]
MKDKDRRLIEDAVEGASALLSNLSALQPTLTVIADLCAETLRRGGKLLFCGNGGSAAESQHLATEFVVRLSSTRERHALSALALTTDTSLLTACSNDYGFDTVFARQVEAHLRTGDVLFLLSTSGKSLNLIHAARAAHRGGGHTVGFLGETVSPLDEHLDHALHVPSRSSQRVQETHLLCGHLLVEMIENRVCESPGFSGGGDSPK